MQEAAADRIHELFNVAVSGRLLNRSLIEGPAGKPAGSRPRPPHHQKQTLEIDLLLYILRHHRQLLRPVRQPCTTASSSTARLTAARASSVLNNLHEDLWLEYKPEVDDFLTQLHNRSKSRHLSFELPREVEIR